LNGSLQSVKTIQYFRKRDARRFQDVSGTDRPIRETSQQISVLKTKQTRQIRVKKKPKAFESLIRPNSELMNLKIIKNDKAARFELVHLVFYEPGDIARYHKKELKFFVEQGKIVPGEICVLVRVSAFSSQTDGPYKLFDVGRFHEKLLI